MSETEIWRHSPGPSRRTVRPWLVAVAALVVVAFGFGPAVSTASAKGGAEVTPKIIGGNIAPDGSWPSQTALLAAGQSDPFVAQFCGGTLIDPSWVLTAAHCVDFLDSPTQLNVAIGRNDLSSVTPGDRIGIRSILINPAYVPESAPNPSKWDFALLELAVPSDAPVTALISPDQASLTAGGQPGAVAGWGCTTPLDGGGNCPSPKPNSLRQADVDFVADGDCSGGASYGGLFEPSMMICAGDFASGTPDTCKGDSGGPLVAFGSGGERLLAGVTSWGFDCALANYPGVYARVLAGRPWILTTIEENLRQGLTVSLKSKPPKRTHSRKATFRFKASKSGSTFECRIDGRSWQKCRSPKTYRNLKRGRKHTFRVKATRSGITGPVKKYTWNVKRR